MHIDYQQFLTDSVLLSTLIYENNGKLEDYPNQFLLDLIDSVGYNSAAPKSNIVSGFDPQAQFSGCPSRHGYTKMKVNGLTQVDVERILEVLKFNAYI